MKKAKVVIGRFQVAELTEGHLYLLDYVNKQEGELIVLIGSNPAPYTRRNELPFSARREMIKQKYPHAIIKCIFDKREDSFWSEEVDEMLKGYEEVMLYTGRDGFDKHYTGIHPVVVLKPTGVEISGTEMRKMIKDSQINSKDWREGVIHAVQNKFPTAYPTVDIAPLRRSFTGEVEVLMGRKSDRTTMCFIGGFVDPEDKSLEDAASRELKEETGGNLQTMELRYISSRKVEDFRYRGSGDGIISSFFITWVYGGSWKATDDIVELKWMDIDNLSEDNVSDVHHNLLSDLKKFINSIK
jgi:ADP-ribose pyrophosphatase YjhB (NUDIX family)/nicotinamide mononucleotide adenylyltransferase